MTPPPRRSPAENHRQWRAQRRLPVDEQRQWKLDADLAIGVLLAVAFILAMAVQVFVGD